MIWDIKHQHQHDVLKLYFRYYGIKLLEISNAVLTESPNDLLEFDDLPKINNIKNSYRINKKAKYKALFFICCV